MELEKATKKVMARHSPRKVQQTDASRAEETISNPIAPNEEEERKEQEL